MTDSRGTCRLRQAQFRGNQKRRLLTLPRSMRVGIRQLFAQYLRWRIFQIEPMQRDRAKALKFYNAVNALDLWQYRLSEQDAARYKIRA